MASRRNFLRWSTLGIGSLPFIGCEENREVNKPIVIATWDSGVDVNESAWEVLKNKGASALDAVEKGAISIENKIVCCVGLGGNPDRDGRVTLDACIMDEKFNCGSVAFLERIKNPISVARKVMENSPHVFLVGEGAQQFAVNQGFALEPEVLSESAAREYENWLKTSEYNPQINIEQNQSAPQKLEDGSLNHDTMGIVALDASQNLSGACTTSGMAFKMRGRIGDSPIIGSGLYVDNNAGAAVATGQGEEVIRVGGSKNVVDLMAQGKSPYEACKMTVEKIININPEKAKGFQVAFIALNKNGEHGAFAIQPNFSYAIKSETAQKLINADSFFN